MDEIICDFLGKLCLEYNKRFNKNIKISDIKSWKLAPYIGEEGVEIINEKGFFHSLKPIKNSIETIKKLQEEGNEIFIISSPTNKFSVKEKYQWVEDNLPFFPIKNLILVGNKGSILSRIKDGVLFDDCPEFLDKFKGIKVVINKPYNQEVEANYRVNNWNEFYKLIHKILSERYFIKLLK